VWLGWGGGFAVHAEPVERENHALGGGQTRVSGARPVKKGGATILYKPVLTGPKKIGKSKTGAAEVFTGF